MVGLRRAIALLLLGFYVTQFAMTAWLGPDDMFPAYLGLALCYGLAFIALGAEWFWGRWFAMGIGNFGSLLLLVLFKVGLEPMIAFFGFTHLAIAVFLLGEGMAARYEHSEATAERWNFQEESLALMRRATLSAGSTLPFLILYALAPRPDAFQVTALVAGAAGLYGLLRGRTWGVLALGGAGTIALVHALGWLGAPPVGYLLLTPTGGPIVYGHTVAILAAGALLVPLMLAPAMVRYVAQRR
ncbi:MAG: hypothetical protein IPH07_13765 [Deltaproteobacteria bacterium]|jgi:hypothetical protein|nr:hypothetical protein [Deltaproteobacteria bacterium]MBK8241224.1 hypothetical protein [Deltaproteobacteria bacterium]MBK8716853.1 hypothetical protein [Deltaproteobacteria bacterium]MBP7286958.1 hypothetical protein [Nannocystaceae bacterium]